MVFCVPGECSCVMPARAQRFHCGGLESSEDLCCTGSQSFTVLLFCASGFLELVSRCQAGFAKHPFFCEYECLTEKLVRATVSAGGISSHLEQSSFLHT